MAIQFKCPGCGAMIRVPDTSAGKKGTCPQCSEKLIVPTVAQGSTATVATKSPALATSGSAEKTELPHLGAPHIDVTSKSASTVAPAKEASPSLESQQGLKLSPLDAKPESATTPPDFGLPALETESSFGLGKKERLKKRRQEMGWVTPVLCGVVLLGILGWFFLKAQPKLEGKLVAKSVSGFEMQPALISGKFSGLSKSDLANVLKHLKASPATWSSTSSKITMTGTDDGVEVKLHPGRTYHLVAVQVAQNKAFLDYIKQHAVELEKSRMAAIQKNAPKFFESWKNHFEKKSAPADQMALRDAVIIPTLVAGAGYHLEAYVSQTKYFCVYEESDGTIYCLLPNATKSFVLQGRKLVDGTTIPANFTVHIEGSIDSVAGPAKKKAKPKTKEDREAENEGMNPELQEKNDMSKPDSDVEAMKQGLNDLASPDDRASSTKSKSARKMKLDMMEDEEMPDDAMPGKPKAKSSKKAMPLKDDMMKDEMMDDEGEMMEKPKSKVKK